MKSMKVLAALASAAVLLGGLSGCTDLENGIYSDGTSAPNNNTMPKTAPMDLPETPSIPKNGDDVIIDELPTPENTEPEITELPEQGTSPAIEDIIQPVVSGESWDYSTLSTESNGYGQGTHFDDLNRPRGALRFNEGYSKYRAKAIDDTEEKTIRLTFDQGYENGYTGIILDTLKEKGVKATFFVVYDYAKRQPELVQRMIDEGHTVGSHSWHHYSMPELSDEEATKEIMDLHDYMLENFGVCMTKFRPPKGEYSERSLAITGDLGYETVLWSFAYADWDPDKQPEPQASLQKLIERAHPGAIYLLHSVSETNAGILGDFIDEMIAQGYTFVS